MKLSIPKSRRSKLVFTLVAVATIFSLYENERAIYNSNKPSITQTSRGLSINLGNGTCEWEAPIYDVPVDTNFFKTLVAGYPSGDKRLTFVQMEALTGLSARDEWDFMFLGSTNQPFVKANYPHHEGIWGWKGVQLGQVAMIVRNIKRSLVEYHDILWDIGYAQTFEQAFENIPNLYQERPPLEDFLKWRDLRVFDEIHWYTWFIDYYMENGLMRDMFNHEKTTPTHWDKLILPNHWTKHELRYKWYVKNATEAASHYDPMCATIDQGCYPVRIISAEKLVVPETGPAEGRKIAELIHGKEGFDEWMIDEEAWQCIWTELIINKRGLKTFVDRDGLREESYDFSFEMFNEMWYELERLITKYGDGTDQVSIDLVALLREHQDTLGITPDPSMKLTYEELMVYHLAFPPFFPDQVPGAYHTDAFFPNQMEFNASKFDDDLRRLKETDFMGPRTRALFNMKKRREEAEKKATEVNNINKVSPVAAQRMLDASEDYTYANTEKTPPKAGRKLDAKEMGANFDFSKLDEMVHRRRMEQLRLSP